MAERKHTPGPWEVHYGTIVEVGNRYSLRCLESHEMTDDGKFSSALFDETRANARLIAAAPELLEALADLADKVEMAVAIHHSQRGGDIFEDDWQKLFDLAKSARSVIAKATDQEATNDPAD
jgi:hypothetical protein